MTPLIRMISYIDVAGKNPKDAAAQVVARLKSPGKAEQRVILSTAPEGQVFNVLYRPNPNFSGRFEALDALQRSLRSGTNAAITAVAGLGGIGKTTLAAEYCHRFRWLYAGVWWIRAEQEPVMLADLQALGQKLGVVANGNIEADARATLDHLQGLTEPWLLVYDNAPNADAVDKWLLTGAARCLITSRSNAFDHLAKVNNLDQWSDAVTADYLLSRTERKDKDGALRLARALGGLPLAAEQAAVHLRPRAGMSFDDYTADIATLIRRPKPRGATGDYPDTVYAAFVESFEALKNVESGETALDLLRLCAFLSPDGVELGLLLSDNGGAALPASFAKPMADRYSREDALAALASRSLLRQENGPSGLVLIFHRLLLDVVRDWMGADVRVAWGGAAVRVVSGVFPSDVTTNPSTWPLCARLMPHVAPLGAYATRTGSAGRELARLSNQAGLYLAARGDRVGALALAKQAVEFGRRANTQPLGVATMLGNVAGRYSDLGLLDEAESTLREALAIEQELLKPDDPSLAITLSNLTGLYRRRKQFAEAEPLLLRAVEIIKAAHGEQSGEYSTVLSNLGALYSDWAEEPGQTARRYQAEDYATRELLICRAARGPRHPETAISHNNLAVMKAKRGDLPEAAADMERTVAIMLSLDLLQHPNTQRAAYALVDSWKRSGQPKKAAQLEAGDISDLLPVIAQIEAEHLAWVAEDPKNRDFGPPSPFAKE